MIYDKILSRFNQGEKQFVILIDPDKAIDSHLQRLLSDADKYADMIFLGGSTSCGALDTSLTLIRKYTSLDVLLFPGNVSQITKGVDAVLFLSLLSGRNAEFLIGNHVKAAPLLKEVEVIPVAYILVDGGRVSATEIVTKTLPMSTLRFSDIVDTALAGEMMGHKMVYLEAGSGACNPVSSHIISQVRDLISIPLIVGGGLKTAADVSMAYEAGADIVVVGNVLEFGGVHLRDLF